MTDLDGDISVINDSRSFYTSLVSGAAAGLVVDVTLFPLDTLKTRLQSQYGFWKSGGFKNIYKGVGPAAVGSAPCAAVFFATYNGMKDLKYTYLPHLWSPAAHMLFASVAETVVCVVKVPIEIVKQRRQAIKGAGNSFNIIRNTIRSEGFVGMYRGFFSTVLRDVPFSFIQFPIWEALKKQWRDTAKRDLTPWEVSLCGAVSGGVSAAITTPLDVAKTRIMLADQIQENKKLPTLGRVLMDVYKTEGVTGLFAGFTPRVVLIFLGGGIFFGVYELSAQLMDMNKKKMNKL